MWMHLSELSALTTAAIFHAVTVQLEAVWISESVVTCWQKFLLPTYHLTLVTQLAASAQ
jgi:hypothetical protein